MPTQQMRRVYRPNVDSLERRDMPAAALMAASQVHQAAAVIDAALISIPKATNPFARLAVLTAAKLQPGDIILSTESAFSSKAIRLATFSDFSHASIYVGDGKIIDATSKGVKIRPLSALTNDAIRTGVVRVAGVTASQQAQVLKTASQRLGRGYNYGGLVIGALKEVNLITRLYRIATGNPLKVSASTLGGGYFCSELVIKAYQTAGITIAPEAGDTPGGILNFALANPTKFVLVGQLATRGK